MGDVVSIRGLCKRFGDKQVLRGLDLTVPAHSVFGFVGKNGAGKTTTMKAILGLLRVDEGELLVDGEKVTFGETATNRHVGYLPDVPAFYSFMTAREYLRLCGECMGMERADLQARIEELLSLVGLEKETHRVKGYSRGMKQRLGIAQALLGRPKLLICDEPTSALDPVGRREILDVLSAVRTQTTVLFSTHILSDVERVCTDVAILHEGRIALQGSVQDITAAYGGTAAGGTVGAEFVVEMEDAAGAASLAAAWGAAEAATHGAARSADETTVVFTGGEAQMLAVMKLIREKGLSLRRMEKTRSSLESLFLEVVGS